MAQSAVFERRSLPIEATHEQPTRPAQLSPLEALAAEAFFSGAVERVRADVDAVARELAQGDGESVRTRVLCVQIALAHVHVVALETLLGTLTKKKDAAGARLVSGLLTDATRRLAILAGAHSGVRQRPVVLVGHANSVSVSAGVSR